MKTPANIMNREYFSCISYVLETWHSFFQLCLGGCDPFLTGCGCGSVWPFFGWVWPLAGCGWIWVSMAIFFGGCGWVWVSVTFFGWLWVSVVGDSCHWVRSMKREYRNFPFSHSIILKQNYIVIFISLPLWKSVRIMLDYINVFLDPQYIVSQEDF